MVGRAVALAALLLTAAPALADESPVLGTLRQFGLLGTWAMDCAHPASPDNEYSVYAISASGEATLSYGRGEPYRDIVYAIRSAERLAPDRLALQVLHMPDRVPVDLVLRKEMGLLQVWSSHTLDGRMLVTEGVITGNGKASPRFQRCTP
ncbi:MAG TPA: hypothetical protein VJN67_25075 [Stellaceae bacterium]|nr:hypothetical protein [Stellaceae bacterium]